MNQLFKKYWLLILIIFIVINFLGYYFIQESINISDALEHVESDKTIQYLERKDFFYTIFIDMVLILDFAIVLFGVYFMTKIVLQFSKK